MKAIRKIISISAVAVMLAGLTACDEQVPAANSNAPVTAEYAPEIDSLINK